MRANLRYTLPNDLGLKAGLVVPESLDENTKSIFPLRSRTFKMQHGSVPFGFLDRALDEMDLSEPELVSVETEIKDARKLTPKPSFKSHGFELIEFPYENNYIGNPSQFDDSINPLYYSQLEAILQKEFSANVAHIYTHVRRSSSIKTRRSGAGAGYAEYIHTDHSDSSWSALLPRIVSENLWAKYAPPRIGESLARRASLANRYAVISAWRYLGPSISCKKSHLAIADPNTINSRDIIDFTLMYEEYVGGNLRLKYPQTGNTPSEMPEFYYYSNATPSELVCFTVFDSLKTSIFENSPIPTCFHGSFIDPSAKVDEPNRESIDARCLLIWD